jgi:hypothetical protein
VNDSGKQQIGQSPLWLLSGCLDKSRHEFQRPASCTLFYVAACAPSDLTPQYRTDSQAVHVLNFISSTSATGTNIIVMSSSSKFELIFVKNNNFNNNANIAACKDNYCQLLPFNK